MVDFLKASSAVSSATSSLPAASGAAAATIACAGRGKIFHIACDLEPRGFEDGEQQMQRSGFGVDAERFLWRALNASGGSRSSNRQDAPALRRTLQSMARVGRSKDQEKTFVSVRLLAHYARLRRRFFLAVGLASTHVHGSSICIPNAVSAEGGWPLGKLAPLAPNRGNEREPPLLTWPNWDLTQWDRTVKKQMPRFDVGSHWERQVIGEYYACSTHIDAQIGALLDALDVLQLAQTTSVVVQGDHGFSLGRHGRWSKYNLYEDGTRVPLIIATPGGRAKVVDDVVESLDVMPTILELWGVKRVPAPPQAAAASSATASLPHYALNGAATPLEGDSLLPYLSPASGASSRPRRSRSYARSEMREWMVLNRPLDKLLPGAPPRYLFGKGVQLYVRTDHHSYTAYCRAVCKDCGTGYRLLDETMYDFRTDAGEAHNLAYHPAYAAQRVAMLSTVIREWNVTLIQHLNGDDRGPLLPPNRTQRLNWLRWSVRDQVPRGAYGKPYVKPVAKPYHAKHSGAALLHSRATVSTGKGGGRGGKGKGQGNRRRGRHRH